MATKQDVLHYLKHDRTLMGARNLYNKFANKNIATQDYLSRLRENSANINTACYQLCKVSGVPDRQMKALLNQPVKPAPDVKPLVIVGASDPVTDLNKKLLEFTLESATAETVKELAVFLNLQSVVPTFSKGPAGNRERKAFVETHNIEVSSKTNKVLDPAIASYLENQLVANILTAKSTKIQLELAELPQEQKESIKLRDQFPFLREQDCPDIFKVLTADLITAYDVFATHQPLLHKNASEEDLKALVATVTSSYIENKQAWAELEHYGKTKTILGEHPLFKILKQEEEIKALDSVKLATKIKNLTSNINKNKIKFTDAETAKDSENAKKYHDLLTEQEHLKGFATTELGKR